MVSRKPFCLQILVVVALLSLDCSFVHALLPFFSHTTSLFDQQSSKVTGRSINRVNYEPKFCGLSLLSNERRSRKRRRTHHVSLVPDFLSTVVLPGDSSSSVAMAMDGQSMEEIVRLFTVMASSLVVYMKVQSPGDTLSFPRAGNKEEEPLVASNNNPSTLDDASMTSTTVETDVYNEQSETTSTTVDEPAKMAESLSSQSSSSSSSSSSPVVHQDISELRKQVASTREEENEKKKRLTNAAAKQTLRLDSAVIALSHGNESPDTNILVVEEEGATEEEEHEEHKEHKRNRFRFVMRVGRKIIMPWKKF